MADLLAQLQSLGAGLPAAGLAASAVPGPAGSAAPEARPVAPAGSALTTVGTPAPTEQLAQALTSSNLPRRMTLHLAPAELGAVQIGIERAPDGPAKVSLLVERPETLLLLMRDQPALHRALDAAGLPAEGRTLHFVLAQPGPASTAAAPALPTPGDSGGSTGAGRDRSAPGDPQGGGSQGRSQGSGYPSGTTEASNGRPPARTAHRTGVDITA